MYSKVFLFLCSFFQILINLVYPLAFNWDPLVSLQAKIGKSSESSRVSASNFREKKVRSLMDVNKFVRVVLRELRGREEQVTDTCLPVI